MRVPCAPVVFEVWAKHQPPNNITGGLTVAKRYNSDRKSALALPSITYRESLLMTVRDPALSKVVW